jgi:HAUS augmin-like complex subunit 3
MVFFILLVAQSLLFTAEISDLERQLAALELELDVLTAQAATITQGKKSCSCANTRVN